MVASLVELSEVAIKRAEAMGALEAEVYAVYARERSMRLLRGSIELSKAGVVVSLATRVSCGRGVSVVGGVVSGVRDVETLVERALSMCKARGDSSAPRALPRGLSSSKPRGIYDEAIVSSSSETMAGILEKLVVDVESASRGRVEVARGSISSRVVARLVANTQREVVAEESTWLTLVCMGVARDAGLESAFWEESTVRRLSDLHVERLAARLADRSLAGLRRTKVETGVLRVLLAPKVSASILDALLAPSISALAIQKKRSPLAGRLGERVLDERVTVLDDATVEAALGSRGFDDEGVESRRTIVVEKGVFKTPLYDTWTASIEGVESTGNAVRPKISSMPEPAPLNLILEPGSEPLESLIGDVKRGLVVYSVIGEWLSDYTRGYLSATITNADYIENGEVKGAVVSGMVSGDFYEMLGSKLLAVGRELEGAGVIYAPPLLIDEVRVVA
ncbi:MAG: TldD/PmbA family protein [Acidilobaceae archaeon]